ncbi:MAG: TRAP transporter TatT component family protein [Gammaproteobacteria bacterium]
MKAATFFKSSLPSLLLLLAGCANIPANYLASSVADGIRNQQDVDTAGVGIPSYLLMVDGLLVKSPRESGLLMAGARLYSTYATLFVKEKERKLVLSDQALEYARRAMCIEEPRFCTKESRAYPRFLELVRGISKRDHLPHLYTYATTWAAWIQVNSSRWSSLADVPKVQALLEAVVELDEDYDHGQAHVYLGVINAQLPPSMGGHPDVARAHFERAIELSKGHNLIAKVEYARTYARLVFDRDLHDRLLKEVLAANPRVNGLTLSNVIAQQQAHILLAESEEYFEE